MIQFKISKMILMSIAMALSCYSIVSGAKTNSSTVITQATAKLQSNCTISMSNFSFGNIVPGQPSTTTTAQLTSLCTKGTAYNITFLFHIWGQDCMYLQGTTSGDRFYYYPTSVDTGHMVGNNYSQAETGTGNTQTFNYVAGVQPASVPEWSGYSVCHGAVYGSYMPINPGHNPYVTPDTYIDTNSVQISY